MRVLIVPTLHNYLPPSPSPPSLPPSVSSIIISVNWLMRRGGGGMTERQTVAPLPPSLPPPPSPSSLYFNLGSLVVRPRLARRDFTMMIQLTTSQYYTTDPSDLRAGKPCTALQVQEQEETWPDLYRASAGGKKIAMRIFLFLTSSSSSCLVLLLVQSGSYFTSQSAKKSNEDSDGLQ